MWAVKWDARDPGKGPVTWYQTCLRHVELGMKEGKESGMFGNCLARYVRAVAFRLEISRLNHKPSSLNPDF